MPSSDKHKVVKNKPPITVSELIALLEKVQDKDQIVNVATSCCGGEAGYIEEYQDGIYIFEVFDAEAREAQAEAYERLKGNLLYPLLRPPLPKLRMRKPIITDGR